MIQRRRDMWHKLLGLCCAAALIWTVCTSRWSSLSTMGNGMSQDQSLRDILNSTLGFQRLFVINLPARSDRRDATSLAAAVSNLDLEYVNGVTGNSISNKAFPPGINRRLREGIKGSWRSHMDAIRRVVEQNLTTALIFEDDVDWDIRFRHQLQQFALASRFLTNTALHAASAFPLKYFETYETEELSIHNQSTSTIPPLILTMPFSQLPRQTRHSPQYKGSMASPYGNPAEWDLLWLGHCGTGFPRAPSSGAVNKQSDMDNVVIALPNDFTVPQPQYLRAHPFGPLDALSRTYSPHTRVYHRATGGSLCTVAYAVSQRGARRILQEFGVREWNKIFDADLGTWCTRSDIESSQSVGTVDENEKAEVHDRSSMAKNRESTSGHVCITSQPPIFSHHRPQDGQSDIGGLAGGFITQVETKYIRRSVRMNLQRLVRGDLEGIEEQWPDDVE